jgi:hypothetical protein
MNVKSEGLEALSGLNGQTLKDKNLIVSEARPKKSNRPNSKSFRNSGGGFKRRY